LHTTDTIAVKKGDDVDDLLRYSVLPKYFPQAGSVDAVKGLLKTQKAYIDIPLPLIALLQNIPKSNYVLSGSSPWSKLCLFLSEYFIHCFRYAHHYHLAEYLAGIGSNVTPL